MYHLHDARLSVTACVGILTPSLGCSRDSAQGWKGEPDVYGDEFDHLNHSINAISFCILLKMLLCGTDFSFCFHLIRPHFLNRNNEKSYDNTQLLCILIMDDIPLQLIEQKG